MVVPPAPVRPAATAEPTEGTATKTELRERLRRLNDLYERGYISEAEYQRRRSQILSEF
ncbi:MAG: SHOCT domain-containing protein [Actinobacteria bacterium]|nr:MAG: SHOCT domain-containing protein [Actinomycetota bacterium]